MGILYKEKKIEYEVLDEDPLEGVFDNNSNSFLALRTVSWNRQPGRLELRRWYVNSEDEETPSKGISFCTDQGPHQLTHLLLKLGYGDDDTIDAIMEDRKINKITPPSIRQSKKKGKDHDNESSTESSSKMDEIKNRIEQREKSTRFSVKNIMDNISTREDG